MRRLSIAAILAIAVAAPAPRAESLTFPQHVVSGSITLDVGTLFGFGPGCPGGLFTEATATGDIAPLGPSSIKIYDCIQRGRTDTAFTLTGRTGHCPVRRASPAASWTRQSNCVST